MNLKIPGEDFERNKELCFDEKKVEITHNPLHIY